MKRDKTIYHEYNVAVNKMGNVPYVIKKLIDDLDKSSIYYETNKENLEKAYKIASEAFFMILQYNTTY